MDRDIIQKRIQADQTTLLNSQGSIEIHPESSEVSSSLLTNLVQDLDYQQENSKSNNEKKWTFPSEVEIRDDIHDYNSDTRKSVSEVFLRRALSKSTGGSMLVLNDGYHLRSYLDNSTGQIHLTQRVKENEKADGKGGEVPLLPAEQRRSNDDSSGMEGGSGFVSSPSRGRGDSSTTSPAREGQNREGHELLSPKGDISTLVSNIDSQPTHTLSDCLFLVGPNKEEVEAMVGKYLSFGGTDENSQKEAHPLASGGGVRERSMSSGRARSASSSSSVSMNI